MTLVLLAPGRSCHAYERTDDVVLVVRGWLLDLVEVNKCRHGRDVRGSSWKTPATHQCECVAGRRCHQISSNTNTSSELAGSRNGKFHARV